MKVAALILGILGGLSGLALASYAHMFMGIIGSSSGPVLYLLPLASFIGAGVALNAPGFAALLLIGSALGWFGLGAAFGYGINVITIGSVLLNGAGGLLALLSLDTSSTGSTSQTSEAEKPYRPEPPTAPGKVQATGFDRARWNALKEYDADIAAVARELEPLGQRWIDEFAASYLALNDKAYISSIVSKITARATEEEQKQREAKEEHERQEAKRKQDEQERLEKEKKLRDERAAAAKKRRGEDFTAKIGLLAIVLVILVIVGGVTLRVRWLGTHPQAENSSQSNRSSGRAAQSEAFVYDDFKNSLQGVWALDCSKPPERNNMYSFYYSLSIKEANAAVYAFETHPRLSYTITEFRKISPLTYRMVSTRGTAVTVFYNLHNNDLYGVTEYVDADGEQIIKGGKWVSGGGTVRDSTKCSNATFVELKTQQEFLKAHGSIMLPN